MTVTQTLKLSSAYRQIEHPGFLTLVSDDRIDFLQRMSTNDLTTLQAGQVITTVLTDVAARILDVLQVFTLNESTLGVVTLPGRAGKTFAFLKGKIFFNDKVTINNRSAEYRILDVYAESNAINSILTAPPDLHHCSVSADGTIAIHQPGLADLESYRLIVTGDTFDQTLHSLTEADVSEFDQATFDALRIASGVPGSDTEWNQSYTPLETNLRWAIAMNKGCYTGQEVIARQVNYDKITRQMARIQLAGMTQPGAKVKAGGKSVGEITSVAMHPEMGAIALGVIKRPHFKPGTQLDIEGISGQIMAIL
jgi:folate-binding protein YgfZ